MCFGISPAKLRILRRTSLRRKCIQATIFVSAFGVPGYSTLPASPTCKFTPFQQATADFLSYALSRMEMSGVQNFTSVNAGANIVRHTASSTSFRLDLEYDEGQSLIAVEGLVRNPTSRDMSIFKMAAMHSFSYFSELSGNPLTSMIEAGIGALQQEKKPSTVYDGATYLLLFSTSDGASMFRIRHIECQ
jgi:hypothetical protein